ncbi:hypothetical protein, partial [Photobacterium sp. R1]
AAVIGGTGSRLSGGKFENGAVTGAFSRLFNDELHHKWRRAWTRDPSISTFTAQQMTCDISVSFCRKTIAFFGEQYGLISMNDLPDYYTSPLKSRYLSMNVSALAIENQYKYAANNLTGNTDHNDIFFSVTGSMDRLSFSSGIGGLAGGVNTISTLNNVSNFLGDLSINSLKTHSVLNYKQQYINSAERRWWYRGE